MTAAAGKRRGYSLIEMACVMVLLTLVIGTLGVLLWEMLEVERAQSANLQRTWQQQALADQFRADVAGAQQAPAQWQQYKAGPHTLILHMKNGQHVLYVWYEGKLERRTFADDKEQVRLLPLDASRVAVEFVRESSDSGLLRLRLAALKDGSPTSGQTVEIAAALGGDWR
jgi:prepilin-type N-terminal cleavage/methylation domain-containing protein